MGMAKRELEQREDLQATALGILVGVEAVAPCEHHEDVMLEHDSDLTDAYKLANSRITSGKLKLPLGVSRRDFTDIIDEAFAENSADSCWSCDRNHDD